MPELPEVETVRLGLVSGLLGKEITDITSSSAGMLAGDPAHILHIPVIGVRRFGKGLIVDFQNGYSLAVHLKMTGQFVFRAGKEGDFPGTHTRVIFILNDKTNLYYNDIRKFGWLKIIKTEDVLAMPFFKSLGREPLRDLTASHLRTLLKRSKAPIKSFLMAQDKIAGLGNIYASEVLFLAGINPEKTAASLSKKEAQKLFVSIEGVLRRAISLGGSTRENFVNTEGGAGSYQKHFLVYSRAGMPCPVCKTAIKEVRIAGRNTFFCPHCQPLIVSRQSRGG